MGEGGIGGVGERKREGGARKFEREDEKSLRPTGEKVASVAISG